MKPILFAGPSIYGIDRRELAAFDVAPPAACGDLLSAARAGARAIGLIDGLFEIAPSVWHKEILASLACGVAVFGAASMGALRAAECCDYGMIGVGEIFEAYRSGVRTADADVAILHAPAELGYMPLTEALVDVEAATAAMRKSSFIGAAEASRLAAAARRLHFTQRTWPDIAAGAGLSDARAQAVTDEVDRLGISQKQDDARALLGAMGAGRLHYGDVPFGRDRFNHTLFLSVLERRLH